MITITFEYEIGEIVTVVPVAAEGRVLSLWASDKGIQYSVAWWVNGDRKEAYLFGTEIKKREVTS